MPLDTNDLKTNEIFLETVVVNKNEKGVIVAYNFSIHRVVDGRMVGFCQFNDVGDTRNLSLRGNIGYGIEEQYRGNHYAGKACFLLFDLARSHDMEYLYITCDPDNYASRKTCEYVGGILENIADVPTDNSLYLEEGSKQKCIYRVNF